MINVIRFSLLAISWASIAFIPKRTFFKFLPVSLFSTVIILTEYLIGGPLKWWNAKGGIKSVAYNGLTFALGPYFVGNLWIFRYTYGKFWLYTLVNLLMDFTLAYPLNALFEKVKLYKLKRIGPNHLFLLSIAYSFVNYSFQLILDKNQENQTPELTAPRENVPL
ncbi:hypothetical protein [Bacillus andreraoultii]|uniref:hypothetical protein n=1 Tax=Bacillus andreraoultii TaxID=1499685 RepID=UPI0005A9AE6E|nr:hypothetical protein [Bacillus andreraoultii]